MSSASQQSLLTAWGLVVLLSGHFPATAQAHQNQMDAAGAKADTAPAHLLSLDSSTYWDGGSIATTRVPSAAMCGRMGPCPSWPLDLVAGARRLRVGLDTPSRSDSFVIELLDPQGALIASAENANQFNTEAFVIDPAPGTWTVRVRPSNVSNASFRMRAKLESSLPEDLPHDEARKPLLPNLRTVPPYEFGFIAPANPLNGVYPPDTINPPLTVLGISPLSCTADEMAPVILGGGAARHCLRFTSGPMNLGPGIYDMRFRMLEDLLAGTAHLQPTELLSRVVAGPMDQVIYYSDGSTETRQAGTYSFHPVHAHFHDDYVLSFQLYKVVDGSGALERVGVGTKSGFCPADQLFADWSRFDQGYAKPGGDQPLGNCTSPIDGVLGLSVGWGDVYRWQRPGMYVEFDGQVNGRYVVRSLVDEFDHVIEANETDNVSYAYIEVEGDEIRILERGWGHDPWDDGKVLFSGPGPAQRAASTGGDPRPSSSDGSHGGGGALAPALIAMLAFANALRRRRPSTETLSGAALHRPGNHERT